MEAAGEAPPHELIVYQRWISWGKQAGHFPSDQESHVFWHYFNMVHAIFSAWEAAKYDTDEDSESPTTPSANSSKSAGAASTPKARGLASTPRSDERMADSRRGRSFPKLTLPLPR